MSVIRKANRVARDEGVVELCQRAIQLIYNRSRLRFENFYFNLKGTQEMSIGNIAATFDSETSHGGPLLRESFRRENEFLREVLSNIRRDDVFWDVGANLGLFSAFAGRVITEGTIVAIEPHPKNVAQLEQNIKYNTDDWIILPIALSDREGTVTLDSRYRDLETTGAKSVAITDSSKEDATTVETAAGDELVVRGEVPPPNVVKMDIEGAEAVALPGVSEVLQRDACRLLYVEVHLPGATSSIEEFDMDYETLKDLIYNLGFEIDVIERTDCRVHLKATK